VPAAVTVLALLIGAVLVTRVSGFVMRRAVRRVAERKGGDVNGRWWRAGASRAGLDSADVTERRRQRTDAAARMLNHVVAVVVWIGVTIVVFHLFDIDAAFFLSSAGFIGAGVAIGGQHKVNDYLTGLSVLFEDRYGVGDELVVAMGGSEPIHAVVDNIGLVTTRLRDQRSTIHAPNAQLLVVRNLSQEAAASTVRLRLPDHVAPDLEQSATAALRNLAGTDQLTDVVFVGDLAARQTQEGSVDVAVRTLRPLDDRARSVLVERAEEALRAAR
jgi:small conductance mechanosensitive channel